MQIAAKIGEFLRQKHFVTLKDLAPFYVQQQIKQAILRFGAKSPNQVVCSATIREISNQNTIIGSFLFAQIIEKMNSLQYTIQKITPIGIICQDSSVQVLFTDQQQTLVNKKFKTMKRKPKARLYLIKIKKIWGKKKNKQNIEKIDQNKSLKPCQFQKTSTKKPEMKPSEGQQSSLQQKKKQKYLKQMQSKNFQQKTIKSSKLKLMNDSSDDQQKILQKFMVQTQPQLIFETQNKVKDLMNKGSLSQTQKTNSQIRNQVMEKISEIQLDEEDAYDLMLKKQKQKQKQKQKAQNKVQNKNTNMPTNLNSQVKRTNEKNEIEKNKNIKKIGVISKTKPVVGQTKLFTYFKNT